MLRSLYIENVAVVKQLNMEPGRRFTVITGETGSGKSVVLDCLSFVTGGRVQKEMLRRGEDRALVSAVFSDFPETGFLDDAGLSTDENGDLEIVRTFTADGRSSLKINRRSVPVSVLKEIGPRLVSIESQNETRGLLDTAFHQSLLDDFASDAALLRDYETTYDDYRTVLRSADELRKSVRDKNMMVDILKYQIKEIDSARLGAADEEEKLLDKRKKLKSLEKIAKYSSYVYRLLVSSEKSASAYDQLQAAAETLRKLSDVMPEASEMAEKLDGYRYEIEDIGETVRGLYDDDEFTNPEKKLDAIESRLGLIERLKRKYGNGISEILAFRDNARLRLEELEDSDDRLSDLENRASELQTELTSKAAALHDARVTAARKLDAEVGAILRYLDMPKARFSASVRRNPPGASQFSRTGADAVEFLIAANPGDELMPLSKVASGGELSRVMLALRSALNVRTGASCVVFDEIDTGVSGSTSERIGRKLKDISASAQVICVTHSPQIASLADVHLLIRKTEVNGRAESTLTELTPEERVTEIARIIGGISVTDTQRDAAREMVSGNNLNP